MSYLEFGLGNISPHSFTFGRAFHHPPKPPFSWFAQMTAPAHHAKACTYNFEIFTSMCHSKCSNNSQTLLCFVKNQEYEQVKIDTGKYLFHCEFCIKIALWKHQKQPLIGIPSKHFSWKLENPWKESMRETIF